MVNFSSFKKDSSKTIQALWISFSNLLSFSFAIISSAILCRYLDISEYGLYKQIMYIYSTLLIVFTLGIPRAYSFFLPINPIEEGLSIIRRISLILFILGGIMSISLFLCSDSIAELLNNKNISYTLKLFSIVPICMIPTMGIENILVVYRYSYVNAIYIFISKFILFFSVILPVIFFKQTCNVAILGFVIASIITGCIAYFIKELPFKRIEQKKNLTVSLNKILQFSIPLFVAGIFGILLQTADQFYISRYFGTDTFAIYSNGAMELPFVGTIVGATATVLLPFFSKELHKESSLQILNVWNNTLTKSAKLIYPLLIYCWIFAPEIMEFLYGKLYIESASYFRICSLINFINIFCFAPLLIGAKKVKDYAFIMFSVAVLLYGVDYLFVNYASVSALMLTVVSLICKLILNLLMFRLVSKIVNENWYMLIPLKSLSVTILYSAIAGLITYFCYKGAYRDNVFMNLCITFSIYSIILISMMYKTFIWTRIKMLFNNGKFIK